MYAERVVGGNYVNFTIDRKQIARYGLTLGDVQDVIATAVGGMNVATTVKGLERYPINLRYLLRGGWSWEVKASAVPRSACAGPSSRTPTRSSRS